MTHPLLELQAADTLAGQMRHRRANLPEREVVATAQAALTAWQRRRDGLLDRLVELDAAIERSEQHSHDIDNHLARLEKQMKTIIAPREAEALQHEIALLQERRSGLDDGELEALEEQSAVDDQITTLKAEEPTLRAALDAAEADAVAEEQRIDAELAAIGARLAGLRAAVDAALLARYDQVRKHQMVVVAELQAHRCSGCHLDLSAGEIDVIKEAWAAGDIADCPQCNRLLIG